MAPRTAIALHVEVVHHFQDGVGVVLAVGVGLHQVKEQVIGAIVGDGVADDAIWYLDLTLAVHQPHIGPVAGEVKEGARPGQASQFLGTHEPFQTVERECAHAANVHPRTHHSKHVRVFQLGQWFDQFKSADLHRLILPD